MSVGVLPPTVLPYSPAGFLGLADGASYLPSVIYSRSSSSRSITLQLTRPHRGLVVLSASLRVMDGCEKG